MSETHIINDIHTESDSKGKIVYNIICSKKHKTITSHKKTNTIKYILHISIGLANTIFLEILR